MLDRDFVEGELPVVVLDTGEVIHADRAWVSVKTGWVGFTLPTEDERVHRLPPDTVQRLVEKPDPVTARREP